MTRSILFHHLFKFKKVALNWKRKEKLNAEWCIYPTCRRINKYIEETQGMYLYISPIFLGAQCAAYVFEGVSFPFCPQGCNSGWAERGHLAQSHLANYMIKWDWNLDSAHPSSATHHDFLVLNSTENSKNKLSSNSDVSDITDRSIYAVILATEQKWLGTAFLSEGFPPPLYFPLLINNSGTPKGSPIQILTGTDST